MNKPYKVIDRVVTYCEVVVEAESPEAALALVEKNPDIEWKYETEYDERLSIEAVLVTDERT